MRTVTVSTFYKSNSNDELGFVINEDSTTPDEVTLWIDECEGGAAYIEDWTYEDTFANKEDAYQYILDNYGEVELLENN